MQGGGYMEQTRCLICGDLNDAVMTLNHDKVLTKKEVNKRSGKRRLVTVGYTK